ncbi:serine/threonine-protein phosphatase [Actinokineospora sp. PR83]|uniref:PP2C family protein-serine/threonine phosphatase n=1 Tax=Actinokineospora sp. PR83 TaxID=2884908 RepID=UPI0027E1E95C|nr:PP2C family protein-serine/threonine phosphatase [Actinokineospora sp. PR83]MCG8919268.1 serine/threonine-protein phosphatase [Actinokineospora sp. PR83]
MTEPRQSTRTAPVSIDKGWWGAPYPAVVLDGNGALLAANEVATLLVPPGDAVPDWLATASAADGHAHGDVGGRGFEAHPVPHGDDDSVTWWLVEDTDTRLAIEALRVERERTALLSDVSSALLASLNLDRCMDVTARLAAEHLADAAVVIAPAARHRYPAVLCLRGGDPVRTRLRVRPEDVPGLAEALQGFPPVPSRWIDPASTPDWLRPDGFGEIGSVVVTPLPGLGVPAGALVLLRRAGQPAFDEGEEVFARLFAARAGAAMSAARMFAQQNSITETLMRELLPPTLHQVGGVEFAGRYRAAQDTERVGGDFYDVHPAADADESLAVLGDVCGKGLEAAVLTGKIRNTLHALLPMSGDHLRVLNRLNDTLVHPHSTRFATMVLASVRREGAGVRLRLTCAGHPPPFIVRADGQVEQTSSRGNLVGVMPRIEATSATVTLAPGETCLLFTDGITEAHGGPLGDEMFGEDRLRRVLADCAGMPAEAIVEHVQMLAAQWIGERPHDDMAVVAITAPRGSHLTAVGGHGPGRYTA